jgi:hypothetical protein
MSRKQKPSQQKKKTSNPGPSVQVNSPAMDVSIDQLEESAKAAGLNLPAESDEALEPTQTDSLPDNSQDLRKRLNALIDAYAAGLKILDSKQLELASLQEMTELETSQNQNDRRLLDKRQSDIEIEQQETTLQIAALNERAEKISAREADADANFVVRRSEILHELEVSHQSLLGRYQQLHEQSAIREREHVDRLASQQIEFEEKLEKLRSDADQKLRDREVRLNQYDEKLCDRDRSLSRAQFDAEEAKKDLADLKSHIESHIEERAAERVRIEKAKQNQAKQASSSLIARIGELEEQLRQREAATRTLENRSPEDIKAYIESLKETIKDLRNDLANRLPQSDAEELRVLREERAGWEQDLQRLRSELGRTESELGRLQIEVDSVEILRDRNTALRENQRLLKAAIDDLRDDIDKRLDKHRDQPVFPEFLRMAEDPKLSSPPVRLFPGTDAINLKEFAEDLRHRIGRDHNSGRPDLFYREKDIRAFLGGLAMSRLHILEGISGIGKSSLPRAFAEAVGGFCDTVSVQAGWRDRNDLFGYFNSFERRYYELPFVQALYKARTEHWSDRVSIILLDEMNLSPPEQYAADLLDVLERQDPDERRFELLSFTPPGMIPRGVDEGRYLPLPPNVWFVGTANHDETTKDFAPKTYDRSFVLKLPGTPLPFTPKKRPPRPPVSCQALSESFTSASLLHANLANDAVKWMDDNLREVMDEGFKVGWGGRLASQIRRYLPVVVSCGGSVGEALDQLIATRVLRKIVGRHNNDEDNLKELDQILSDLWPCQTHGPDSCRQLIADEL